MRSSRDNRVRLLLAIAAFALAGLVLLDKYHSSPAATTATTGKAPSAATVPASVESNPATSNVAASTTSPPQTSPPTTSAAPPIYTVATADLSIQGHDLSGATVALPTTVLYPTVTSGSKRFGLVVFSPGFDIDPTVYLPLISAWAAAGFVVAEVSYPDTLPSSPLVEYNMVNHPSELSQVITDFVGGSPYVPASISTLVNPTEVAVAGQSDGGDVSLASAAAACCMDTRIKAAIILSGAEEILFGDSYFAHGSPPILVVQGGADTVNVPACSEQIYDGAPQPRYYLAIPAATHLSAYSAPVGPELLVTRSVTVAFLEKYLDGASVSTSQLDALASSQGSVASLVDGTAAVPLVGSCEGAPPGP